MNHKGQWNGEEKAWLEGFNGDPPTSPKPLTSLTLQPSCLSWSLRIAHGSPRSLKAHVQQHGYGTSAFQKPKDARTQVIATLRIQIISKIFDFAAFQELDT